MFAVLKDAGNTTCLDRLNMLINLGLMAIDGHSHV